MDRVHILYNSLDNSDRTNFSVSLKNPDLEIFADQNLISQVLINLLKNASKLMKIIMMEDKNCCN